MCGIAGIVGGLASAERAKAMSDRLAHRGPDGEGVFAEPGIALSHRRLAVQDLSEAGYQPMIYGEHVLTYNGEIYNHLSLRAKLPGEFKSSGDTEVLLRLLATRGTQGLSDVAGMFAFALWHQGERRLILARDRLGIKPLYYRLLPDGIAFASELKALTLLGASEIDKSALRDFLLHGYVPAPKSIYRGVHKLPAGHILTWQSGRLSVERYWQPDASTLPRATGAAVSELDALLKDVVPAHTLSDVPVGVFLSGGIDSALITSYLERPHTYTLGFEAAGRSETEAAARLAAHFHTIHKERAAPAADFEEALALIPRLFDEPFGDSAAWSNYLVAEFARREVTVALSGEGGDEVFMGYPRYWSHIGERSGVLNRALAGLLPPLSRLASSMQGRSRTGIAAYAAALGGMSPPQIEALLADEWLEADYDYFWFYRAHYREDLSPLSRLRWLDVNTALAEGLLTKVDRTSMAHSLEVRPPLLDHRVVEFMLRVDPSELVNVNARRGKLAVRKLLEPRLPQGHLNQPKSGFGLPVHRFLKERPRLLRAAVQRLKERGVVKRDVPDDFRRAWYLLVLDRWFTAFA
jgi:asparagine synthase (glutamine-hydrolysing)